LPRATCVKPQQLKALRDKVYAHTDSVIKIGGEKVRARDVERIRGQRLIRVGELERFLREHLEAPRPAAAPHPAGRLPSLPEAVVDRRPARERAWPKSR
jgi:hypothetical protein